MPKRPRVAGQEMIRLLERQAYITLRTRGSHVVLRRGDRLTTVPVHGSRSLKIGTLRKILRDVDLTPLEFAALWSA